MVKRRNICDKCDSPYEFTGAGLRCQCTKRNKYNAKRTLYDGVTYDSMIEAAYAESLDMELRDGKIRGWIRQAKFRLGPDFATRVDFLVFGVDRLCHVVEVKGSKKTEGKRFKDVRRLWVKYAWLPMKIAMYDYRMKSWSTEWLTGKDGDRQCLTYQPGSTSA